MTDTTAKTDTDTIERTAIVTYQLLRLLQEALAAEDKGDIVRGIIMGTAMFSDNEIGPFRTGKLMRLAPDIVLRKDAHVTDALAAKFQPVLRAFGEHLLQRED